MAEGNGSGMKAVLVLSALLAPSILAQDWDPMPPDELSLQRAPRGLRLNAMLLYRSVAIDDQKRTTEEHLRVKILKEEGRDQADIEIPFIKGFTEVVDIRARTVQPDGKITPFEGMIFEKTIMRAQKFRYLTKTFTMPEARVGAILEYRYTIKRKELRGGEWRLQSGLFTLHARFSVKPAHFDHGRFDPPMLQWTALNVKQDTRPKVNPDGGFSLELDDVPAFESEPYTLPEHELIPRFLFYYLSTLMNITAYWQDTIKAWSDDAESFLGKPKAMAEAAASIVRPSDSDDEKLQKIYARVQSLRDLSHGNGRTSQELKRDDIKQNRSALDVWKRGYGTGRDMDLLFVALARAAGFDSYFVRYVGRNKGVFHRSLPDAQQFNGFLAVVALKKAGGGIEDVFLDPAVPGLRYGMLDWDSTGVAAVQLGPEGGGFIDIHNRPEWGGTIHRKGTLNLDTSGGLSGTVVVSFTGQEALSRRKEAKELELDETRRVDDLEETVKGWVSDGARVKLLKMSGWEDTEESLTGEFSVEIPDFAASTPHRLLTPATVFRTHRLLRDAMQHSDRVHPFYFSYAWQEDDDLTIRLPPGADVEELPGRATTESNLARYRSWCEKQPGAIQLKRVLALDGIIFRDTAGLRSFFNSVRLSDENMAMVRRPVPGGSGR